VRVPIVSTLWQVSPEILWLLTGSWLPPFCVRHGSGDQHVETEREAVVLVAGRQRGDREVGTGPGLRNAVQQLEDGAD
jgi:hypothetical protein